MHNSLTSVAFAGATALLLMVRTEPALAPAEPALAACVPLTEETPAEPAAAALDPVQRALVEYLSRRFTIAGEATERVVEAAYRAGEEVGLDPLLLLAMISVESRFNPFAESATGAKGLMQIIPRYHLETLAALGGAEVVLEPEANIFAGAQILQQYVYRTGTLEAGLQSYNGAKSDGLAQYAQRVFAERARIEQAVLPSLRRAQLALNNSKGS